MHWAYSARILSLFGLTLSLFGLILSLFGEHFELIRLNLSLFGQNLSLFGEIWAYSASECIRRNSLLWYGFLQCLCFAYSANMIYFLPCSWFLLKKRQKPMKKAFKFLYIFLSKHIDIYLYLIGLPWCSLGRKSMENPSPSLQISCKIRFQAWKINLNERPTLKNQWKIKVQAWKINGKARTALENPWETNAQAWKSITIKVKA